MKNRYQIPSDISEKVYGLLLDLVNASEADDSVLHAIHYEKLRELCEEQTAAGRGSGFIWEALADVTDDSTERLAYYERALAWARHNSEPTHTIFLEVGRIHAESGDWLRAGPILIEARQQAIAAGDIEAEGEAISFLLGAPVDHA